MKKFFHEHVTSAEKPEYVMQAEKDRLCNLQNTLHELITDNENIVLEIGCGHGRFLTAYAGKFPQKLCIGIDLISKRLRACDDKKKRLNLSNITFLKAKAEDFVEVFDHNYKLNEIFILFPDPWPKKQHCKRRLIQHEFINKLHVLCKTHAKIFFRTDHEGYFEWTKEIFKDNHKFQFLDESEWIFEKDTVFQDLAKNFQSLIIETI